MESSDVIEVPERVPKTLHRSSGGSALYPAIIRSVSGRYVGYFVQILSLTILARLFTPREFGIVASVQVFYAFFQMFADVGFGPALINVRSLSKQEIGGIFLTTTVLGAALGLILYAASEPLERFYSVPAVTKIIPSAAGALVFYASAVVPTAALNREMRFLQIAKATVIAEALSTAAAICLRSFVDPATALASKMVISAFCQFASVYLLSVQTEFGRPIPSFNLTALKEIWWFSKHQFSFSLVNYFSRNLDNILVGRLMGATALGIYDKAYQLMKYPLSLLTFAMMPAIQPTLRKHVSEPQYVEAVHREFAYRMAWLGFVAGISIWISAPWIIQIILGPNWAPVAPVIRALALSIPTQVVLSTSGSFFQAMNRPDLLLLSGLLSAALIVLAMLIGIHSRDLVLLSWFLSLSFNLCFLQSYFVLYKYAFRSPPFLLYRRLRAQISLNFLILIIGNPLALRAFRAN